MPTARWSSRSVAVLCWTALAACSESRDRPPVAGASVVGAPAATASSSPDAADVVSGATPALDAGTMTGGAAVGAAAATEGGARELRVPKPLRGTRAEKAPVVVARGDDPAELARRMLDEVDVAIPADARVVVKVNLGGFDRMKPGRPDDGVAGRITNPAFVRALVLELRRRGVEDLVIADGAGDPARWEALLELSGYAAVSRETGVPIVDLNHYGEGDARPAAWRMTLPWARHLKDELILSDVLVNPTRRTFLIDVPKLKAHRFAVMSLSIKNLMGTVMWGEPGAKRRWRMHRELSPWLDAWKKSRRDDRAAYRAALAVFSERLADLYGAVTPDLVIIEGLPAVQGDGFAAVVPYGGRGIVIASRNGCYADWVAARFFGLADSDALEAEIGFRMPPAIQAVAERYYGGVDALRRVEVRGDAYLPASGDTAWYKAMAPFEIGSSGMVLGN